MVLRIIMLIMGTFLLTYTTSPISLTDALEHLLTKMQKMGSTNTQIILNTQLDRGLAFDE